MKGEAWFTGWVVEMAIGRDEVSKPDARVEVWMNLILCRGTDAVSAYCQLLTQIHSLNEMSPRVHATLRLNGKPAFKLVLGVLDLFALRGRPHNGTEIYEYSKCIPYRRVYRLTKPLNEIISLAKRQCEDVPNKAKARWFWLVFVEHADFSKRGLSAGDLVEVKFRSFVFSGETPQDAIHRSYASVYKTRPNITDGVISPVKAGGEGSHVAELTNMGLAEEGIEDGSEVYWQLVKCSARDAFRMIPPPGLLLAKFVHSAVNGHVIDRLLSSRIRL